MSGGGTRAQQFMTDLAAMVDHFTGLPTRPVVFLALPPAIFTNTFGISESVTFNQIAPIIQQVATQKGMPIIDVHAPTAGHSKYFSDGVHPTDAGYMIVAQIMHDGLLRPLTGAGGAGGGAGRGGSGGASGSAGRGGSSGASGERRQRRRRRHYGWTRRIERWGGRQRRRRGGRRCRARRRRRCRGGRGRIRSWHRRDGGGRRRIRRCRRRGRRVDGRGRYGAGRGRYRAGRHRSRCRRAPAREPVEAARAPDPGTGMSGGDNGGCACSAGASPPGALIAGFALLGFLLGRRRQGVARTKR